MPIASPHSPNENGLTFFLSFVLALFLFSGCTWTKLSEEGFNRREFTADAQRGVALRLADYTSFTWDHVHIFGPHTPRDTVTKEVGWSVPFPHVDSGNHCLLVFVSHEKIAAAFEVEMKVADFSHLFRRRGYVPPEAIFTFENGKFYQWRDDRAYR